MVLALRIVLPLLGMLCFMASGLWLLVGHTTDRWFRRDVETRLELVRHSISDRVAELVRDNNRLALERLFNSVAQDERLVGIGFYIAICLVLGTLGGRELDKVLDTGKLFIVLGLLTGLVLALYGTYQQLMEVLAAINRRRAAGKRD